MPETIRRGHRGPVPLTGVYKNMTGGIALVFRANITGSQLAMTDESATFR
jgi:hypothetical protein